MNKTTLISTLKNRCALTLIVIMSCSFMYGQYRLDPNVDPITVHEPTCVYYPKPGTSLIKSKRAQDIIAKMEGGSVPCTTINVNYNGFTPEAEAAFQFAVDIWAHSIESSMPITVNAAFETAPNPNNLGSARPNAAYAISAGPGEPTYIYPSALAEKLLEEELFDIPFPLPGEPSIDILADFNDTQPWYFGTDANPPANQFDFVTVVLHELGHGLGFSAIFNKIIDTNSNGTVEPGIDEGRVRFNGNPVIYDVFVENGTGDSMLSFPDPSVDILNQLTGGDLFNNAPQAIAGNGNVAPRVYAPSDWAGGSSYSHWDDATFPAGNANALMTPFAGIGEANHDPGPSTLGLFEAMGWTLCASLSVDEFSLEDIAVTPNPFLTEIRIQLPNGLNDDYRLSLYDINGRVLMSELKAATNGELNLNNLDNLDDALYFLEITNITNGASITKKLMKR